ncbi:MAG: hypothetical protein JSU94_03550 [Phycisphaerales bacterium]|nr:MAG: hypothetical protein JSU94_03550 [Phycisphaerales bacterium]
MSKKAKKAKRAIALIAVNVAGIIILLYACEIFLLLTAPKLKLPIDGFSQGKLYTWGHEVVNNRYGFREREFAVPKPEACFRVMVLGDSFTWGAGLPVEQRYTNVLESLLGQAYPGRQIEVLNFGTPGGPTVGERDILRAMKDAVGPDVVVVGFCLNDTQPKSQHYSVEREAFERKYGGPLRGTVSVMNAVGLSQMGKVVYKAVYRFAEVRGVIPRWQAALQRTYERDSRQWRRFVGALKDIKTMCDQAGISPPIFAVLNQGTHTDRPTDYGNPDDELKLYLKWYHQAEAAAREAGFATCNHEKEIAAALSNEPLAVNVVDVHPSAGLNRVYASKLFELVSLRLEKQRPPGH